MAVERKDVGAILKMIDKAVEHVSFVDLALDVKPKLFRKRIRRVDRLPVAHKGIKEVFELYGHS